MSCGNSRSSKCNPCGPSEAAINAIADRAAYYARIAITASETGGGIRWGYIGDGVEATFNIDGAATTNSPSFLVTINGVVQDPLDYTITSGFPYTITMNNPVPSGSEIIIVSLNGLTGATGPQGTPGGATGATGAGATGATGLGATGATGPGGPSGTAAAGGMRWSYTGNGTQTIFNISGASTLNASAYSVNIDGITQDPNNYTIQSGSPYTLTMSQAVPSNSVIVIVSIVGPVGATGLTGATGPISGATGATGATGPSGSPYASNFGNVWSYIGNGSQTVFAITGGLSILAPAYLVTIDGVFQKTTNYTIDNVIPKTLTFSQAVPNGSEINIVSLSVA